MTMDERWMGEAIQEARAALAEGEVPVGAVVVQNGLVIARGHNLCCRQNDPTAHAEMLVLREAYKKLGNLSNCTLYVTLEPCAMCAGAMTWMKLPRLIYGAFDERCGCVGSQMDLTDHWFYHSVESWGGIREEECTKLLREFFETKR